MMKVPVSLDQLARSDLFFRMIERWKSVAMCKPEKTSDEHGEHQHRDPPINSRVTSRKRLKLPMAHKAKSGGQWETDPTRTLRAPEGTRIGVSASGRVGVCIPHEG